MVARRLKTTTATSATKAGRQTAPSAPLLARLPLGRKRGNISIVTLRRTLRKRFSFKHIRHSLKAQLDETGLCNTQDLLKLLQQREYLGEHELYYFDESALSQSSSIFYALSPIGKPCEVIVYSHSRRLYVLSFLSRAGKLAYHIVIKPVTTETVLMYLISLWIRKILTPSPLWCSTTLVCIVQIGRAHV